MNNGMILCEGETDQILIGEYLSKRQGWQYTSKAKSLFPGERINGYRKNDSQYLGIWAVGGNDFREQIEKIADRQSLNPEISKVAVMTDYDDATAKSGRLEMVMSAWKSKIEPQSILASEKYINQWAEIAYKTSFGTIARMQFCYLLVPADGQGALETFMLKSLSNSAPEKENVIRQSEIFVDNFQSSEYLTKRREKVKAKLGVALSVFCPDKVFTTMNELLESVDWSESEVSRKQFGLLEEI